MTVIVDQALPKGWSFSGALRYATGKPFTPVTGATRDAQRNRVDADLRCAVIASECRRRSRSTSRCRA